VAFPFVVVIIVWALILAFRSADSHYQAPSASQDPGFDPYEPEEDEEDRLETLPILPPPKPLILDMPIPMASAFKRRFNLWFRSRSPDEEEIVHHWAAGLDHLALDFPVPRQLLTLKIIFKGCGIQPVFKMEFQLENDPVDLPWSGSWRLRKQGAELTIAIGEPLPVSRLLLEFPEAPPNVGVMATVKLLRRNDPDRELIAGGKRAMNLGQVERALDMFSKYEKIWSRHNPAVIYNLAQIHASMSQLELAQFHAVRLMTYDMAEFALALYNQISGRGKWRHRIKEIQGYRDQARNWDLAGHHGLVVLNAERRFVVGINSCHMEQYSDVTEILRRAAARKLCRLVFPIKDGRSLLVSSSVRIIRSDGSVVKLPSDRFSVIPAEDDNPFIPVARKSAGQWILPDLEVGDAVELNYCLLHSDKGAKPDSNLFLMSNFTSGSVPTLRGRVEILNPYDLELDFAQRNNDLKPEVSQDPATGFQRFSFTRHELLPCFNTGHPYERTLLNPLVACSTKGKKWVELAESMIKQTRDALANHEGPPEPLLKAMDGPGGKDRDLARAFYWVRDRIKYGSLASANQMIDSEMRAANLVAAGIGDCKDKSFLLALACRHIGLDYDFVFVSSDNGLVVDELPADQFDHIILRAKLPGGWVYLDAASDQGTFSNIPFGLQGLRGLIPGNGGELITFPVDPPNRNRIQATEYVTEVRDGWLMTDLELALEGIPARFLDETWKSLSLTSKGATQAAETCFRMVFPNLVVDDFQRKGDTSNSDLCTFSCQGRRSRLVAMGDRRLASFGWSNPGLNLEWIRRLDIQDTFVFPFCHELDARIEFTGRARDILGDISRVENFQADFGCIKEDISRGNGSIILRRGITVSERTIQADAMADLPGFLNASEDVLGVVAAF